MFVYDKSTNTNINVQNEINISLTSFFLYAKKSINNTYINMPPFPPERNIIKVAKIKNIKKYALKLILLIA